MTTAPATDDARRWSGWGTALKPGYEPIVVARKPLAGTVAANVLAHGTGALNIDACRVGYANDEDYRRVRDWPRPNTSGAEHIGSVMNRPPTPTADASPVGRWPANVVLDDQAAAELDAQSGVSQSPSRPVKQGGNLSVGGIMNDSGGASRFFPTFRYQAKAPTAERPVVNGVAHPTVKPLDLMRWLVRLVTPPGGLILDPFAGSGTTLEAAVLEGFRVVGVEQDPQYLPLIQHRIGRARRGAQPGVPRPGVERPAELDGQLDLLVELGGIAGGAA